MDDPRYHTKRWQQLRAQVIARDGRRCSHPDCPNNMNLPGMTHVDHIIEKDDGGPFWDPANLQILCKPHHDVKTLTVAAHRTEPTSPNG